MKFIKNNLRYILVFIFIFFIYEFVAWGLTFGDPIYNYGFSHAIKLGEIPYRDFNMIVPPAYAFFMSLGLHLWDNYVMFLLEESILVTMSFYFLYKVYNKKAYLLIIPLVIFNYFGILPTYNFGCFFLLIVLLYLEKEYSNKDFLIGLVIGIAILTKHTVGCLFVIPSIIYYFKNPKKLFKRFQGGLLILGIFLIYLVVTGSFYSFIDLCVGGLLDFSIKNGKPFTNYFYYSLILFILSIFILVKDKKNMANSYLLMGVGFVIPIFDSNHFALFLLCFSIMLLSYIEINDKYIYFLVFMALVFSLGGNFYINKMYDLHFMKKFNHFNYTLMAKKDYLEDIKVSKILRKYDDAIFLSYSSMRFDICYDKNINYFDVLFYGNYGYNGSNKMIKKIEKMHDKIFVVDRGSYLRNTKYDQFDKKIVDFIIKNSKKVESVDNLDVYYME